MNLLDKTGLTYFWGKIKAKFLSLSGGTMTGTIVTPANNSKGIEPATDSYGRIGSGSKRYKEMNAIAFYGELHSYSSDEQDESTDVTPGVIMLDNQLIDRTMTIYPNDIVLSGTGSDTTWDGINTSLQGAIYAVNNKVDNKNTSAFFESFNNVTVRSSTITNFGSHRFAAGGWLIEYYVAFSSNASGLRRIMISNTSNGDVRDRFAQIMMNPISGTETRIKLVTIQSITKETTLYFNGVQNSGSNLTASAIGIKGVKLY